MHPKTNPFDEKRQGKDADVSNHNLEEINWQPAFWRKKDFPCFKIHMKPESSFDKNKVRLIHFPFE